MLNEATFDQISNLAQSLSIPIDEHCVATLMSPYSHSDYFRHNIFNILEALNSHNPFARQSSHTNNDLIRVLPGGKIIPCFGNPFYTESQYVLFLYGDETVGMSVNLLDGNERFKIELNRNGDISIKTHNDEQFVFDANGNIKAYAKLLGRDISNPQGMSSGSAISYEIETGEFYAHYHGTDNRIKRIKLDVGKLNTELPYAEVQEYQIFIEGVINYSDHIELYIRYGKSIEDKSTRTLIIPLICKINPRHFRAKSIEPTDETAAKFDSIVELLEQMSIG